jgi:hypothetical protein
MWLSVGKLTRKHYGGGDAHEAEERRVRGTIDGPQRRHFFLFGIEKTLDLLFFFCPEDTKSKKYHVVLRCVQTHGYQRFYQSGEGLHKG